MTEFNGQKLLDGSLMATQTNSVVIQIGIRATTNDRISLNTAVDLTAITTTGLAIQNTNVLTATSSLAALSTIDSAIAKVTDGRGRLGAVQNRLVHTLANLSVSAENLTAADSQIRDTDYATEISKFTQHQILVQASTSILAQANQVPQSVLSLLG